MLWLDGQDWGDWQQAGTAEGTVNGPPRRAEKVKIYTPGEHLAKPQQKIFTVGY